MNYVFEKRKRVRKKKILWTDAIKNARACTFQEMHRSKWIFSDFVLFFIRYYLEFCNRLYFINYIYFVILSFYFRHACVLSTMPLKSRENNSKENCPITHVYFFLSGWIFVIFWTKRYGHFVFHLRWMCSTSFRLH